MFERVERLYRSSRSESPVPLATTETITSRLFGFEEGTSTLVLNHRTELHGRAHMPSGPALTWVARLIVLITMMDACGCARRSVWHNSSDTLSSFRDRPPVEKPPTPVVALNEIQQASASIVANSATKPSAEDTALTSAKISAAAKSLAPRDARQEPTQFQDISLESVMQIALASSPVIRSIGGRLLDNPTAATTVYDAEISASDPFFGPQAALAQFDSVLNASLTSANNDRVFNNVVLGGNAQELVQDLASANASIQRRSMTGATFDIGGLHGYDANNRTGNLFPSYWESQMEAGVRQPLLRGAGRKYNSIAGPNAQPGFNFSNGLVIAQMNTQMAAADFEIAVHSFARELHEAYWSLHRAYRSYYNKQQTRDLAYETWQTVSAKAMQGLEGGEVDKESQAKQKYFRYQRAVVSALGGGDGEIGVFEAERRLRHLMGLPLMAENMLRPSDPLPVAPVNFDWDSLVALSMSNRAELRRQNIRVHQQQMKLIASKNFLLPQLDVIGRYRVRGFGDDLTGGGPRFASSYNDFFSLDHQEFEFGVEWGVTAGRRQARAAVRNASLQLTRERLILAEQQRELTAKLSEAVSKASSIYSTMQSAQEELNAAEARMKSTFILYEVGKSDLFMLLDARESWLEVSDRNVMDQVQYSLALVDVSYQSGRILQDAGVDIAGSHSVYPSFLNSQGDSTRPDPEPSGASPLLEETTALPETTVMPTMDSAANDSTANDLTAKKPKRLPVGTD